MSTTSEPTPDAAVPALRARGICKSFGDVRANVEVGIDLYAGEIHAVVGENGAGKTTLTKMLSGAMQPDAGDLEVGGRPVSFASPQEAARCGIGMVYQHYSVVPEFTLLDNLLLSVGGNSARILTRRQRDAAESFLLEEGFTAPRRTCVRDLSVDEVQRFEISKLLYNGAKIVILDEPTAVLGPVEVEKLYARLRDLAERGHAVVVITHKLAEVEQYAQRVTVMRGGRTVEESIVPPGHAELLAAMFGSHVSVATSPPAVLQRRVDAPVVLAVDRLTVRGADGRVRLDGVSFELVEGEVVAVLGVEGNGQAQLMDAIAGVTPSDGSIRLRGQDVQQLSPADRHRAGMRAVTEDRLTWDVFVRASLAENMLAHSFAHRPALKSSRTSGPTEARIRDLMDKFDVRPRAPRLALAGFSGGNQQRAVIAREAVGEMDILVLSQPTRGLDIVSSTTIMDHVAELAASGIAVIWNTADIDEAYAVSHRLIVMSDGRVTLDRPTATTSRQQVATAMSGTEVA